MCSVHYGSDFSGYTEVLYHPKTVPSLTSSVLISSSDISQVNFTANKTGLLDDNSKLSVILQIHFSGVEMRVRLRLFFTDSIFYDYFTCLSFKNVFDFYTFENVLHKTFEIDDDDLETKRF